MNTMNDSVEQKCYLEYLISKYILASDDNLRKQMMGTQYNVRNTVFDLETAIEPLALEHSMEFSV